MAEKTNTQNAATPNGMTKMEGVKLALEALGPKAKPTEIKDYVETQLGIEISLNVANSYKKTWTRRAREQGQVKPAAKAAAPKKQVQPAASRAQPAKVTMPGVAVEDVATAKGLLERVGHERLRELIAVLAR